METTIKAEELNRLLAIIREAHFADARRNSNK